MALARDGSGTKPDYTAVPSVVFSSPQLAYVGKKEDAAVEEFQDVDVYTSTSTYEPTFVQSAAQSIFCSLLITCMPVDDMMDSMQR